MLSNAGHSQTRAVSTVPPPLRPAPRPQLLSYATPAQPLTDDELGGGEFDQEYFDRWVGVGLLGRVNIGSAVVWRQGAMMFRGIRCRHYSRCLALAGHLPPWFVDQTTFNSHRVCAVQEVRGDQPQGDPPPPVHRV